MTTTTTAPASEPGARLTEFRLADEATLREWLEALAVLSEGDDADAIAALPEEVREAAQGAIADLSMSFDAEYWRAAEWGDSGLYAARDMLDAAWTCGMLTGPCPLVLVSEMDYSWHLLLTGPHDYASLASISEDVKHLGGARLTGIESALEFLRDIVVAANTVLQPPKDDLVLDDRLPAITFADEATDSWLTMVGRMALGAFVVTLTLTDRSTRLVRLNSAGYHPQTTMAGVEVVPLDDDCLPAGERYWLDTSVITNIEVH